MLDKINKLTLREYVGNIARTPILAIGVILISAIALYFDTPIIIPVFAASLFTIIIYEESRFSKMAHVGISHIITFVLAMTAPLMFNQFGFGADTLPGIITIGMLVFVAALIQTIFKVEHPPAIAAIIVLFEVGQNSNNLLLGIVPLNLLISFGASLLIVLAAAKLLEPK